MTTGKCPSTSPLYKRKCKCQFMNLPLYLWHFPWSLDFTDLEKICISLKCVDVCYSRIKWNTRPGQHSNTGRLWNALDFKLELGETAPLEVTAGHHTVKQRLEVTAGHHTVKQRPWGSQRGITLCTSTGNIHSSLSCTWRLNAVEINLTSLWNDLLSATSFSEINGTSIHAWCC